MSYELDSSEWYDPQHGGRVPSPEGKRALGPPRLSDKQQSLSHRVPLMGH